MTNSIQTALMQALPTKRKQTPSGWLAVNAVCCHNRGETQDKRMRGGVKSTLEGSFQWHCFNCGFKANYTPGRTINQNMRKLMGWLGMDTDSIRKLAMEALRLKDDTVQNTIKTPVVNIVPKKLPEGSKPISEWVSKGNHDPYLLKVVEYIQKRGLYLDDYDWHWSPSKEYDMRNRLIIPYYWRNKIVGSTARLVIDDANKPKYYTDQQPGYVFNLDKQDWNRKFVIVTEGPIDAILIEGVSVLGSKPNQAQKDLINRLTRQVIVGPDRDKAGLNLVNIAKEFGWSIAFPDWCDSVNDVAESVKHYGKLMTLRMILASVETTSLKIDLVKDHWTQ